MDERELIKKAAKLIRRYDNMRILGARGEWSGNARQGFMFNPQRGGGSSGGGAAPVTGACCFDDGTCSITSSTACLLLGGTYLGDGTSCFPNPCAVVPTGACCLDGECSITTQEDCTGVYQGDGTICETVDCGEATSGACCVGESCSIQTPDGCAGLGGVYQGDDTTCDPNPCTEGATGACCLDGECSVSSQETCIDGGGTYMGDGSNCENPLTCACPCGFNAFDESDTKYLRYRRVITGTVTLDEENNCDFPDHSHHEINTNCSATYEGHYEDDGFGGCNFIVDSDVSSSDYTETSNGVVIFTCSRSDIQCFCPSGAPHNECSGFPSAFTSNCACSTPTVTVNTTEDARTTTWEMIENCTIECFNCDDCSLHCTVNGLYTVEETLLEPCVPI